MLDIGPALECQLKAAIPAYVEHQAAFIAFDSALRRFRPDQVDEWQAELSEWENNTSAPCPYESTHSGMYLSCGFHNHYLLTSYRTYALRTQAKTRSSRTRGGC